jgi:2',3'-cyclic-nucleotide 2'-phosphodiesterase (5'-nucleotidase family)
MASLVSSDGQAASGLSNRIARTCLIHVAGQPIGIVGATTTELRQISSPGTVGINTNLVDSIQAAVDSLLATGVNKVILLAHLQQYRNEFDLATRLRGVDIIIAGGSHAVFSPAPATDSAPATPPRRNTRPGSPPPPANPLPSSTPAPTTATWVAWLPTSPPRACSPPSTR